MSAPRTIPQIWNKTNIFYDDGTYAFWQKPIEPFFLEPDFNANPDNPFAPPMEIRSKKEPDEKRQRRLHTIRCY